MILAPNTERLRAAITEIESAFSDDEGLDPDRVIEFIEKVEEHARVLDQLQQLDNDQTRRIEDGVAAIAAGDTDDNMLRGDLRTGAVDAVANICHALHAAGEEPRGALDTALNHFEAERFEIELDTTSGSEGAS